MIKTTTALAEELKNYKAPNDKIRNMVKNKELFPIIRGLYETDGNTSGYLLASSIYNPSYLSFDFALSFYGLIPEAVYTFTSATFKKNRRKVYKTTFGTYTYRDVPEAAYFYGVKIHKQGDCAFLMAEPEKALCDKLYTLAPVRSQMKLVDVLFNNQRIDRDGFENLDKRQIIQLASLYRTSTHRQLIKMMELKKL